METVGQKREQTKWAERIDTLYRPWRFGNKSRNGPGVRDVALGSMCHLRPCPELTATRNRKVSPWLQLIAKKQRKLVLNIETAALTLLGARVRVYRSIVCIDVFPEPSRLRENN